MIGAARRWFRRNRKGLAIGAGVLGAGYLAGQYVLSKISEARERMSSDRIAREKYVLPASFVDELSWLSLDGTRACDRLDPMATLAP